MNKKMLARIIAGVLAGLMILGAITLTITFLFPHAHFIAQVGLPM